MIIDYNVPEIWHMTDLIRIFHFGQFFAQTAWKMKVSKKIIKTKCLEISSFNTKNHDYILYSSWEMAFDGCNCYFSFWAIFCPFTSLTAQKMKISKKKEKKRKKHLEISSFYTSAPKSMITWFTLPEIWGMTDFTVIFHFGQFFCPFTILTAQKLKISKN